MKKRFLSLLLCATLCISCSAPIYALESADVNVGFNFEVLSATDNLADISLQIESYNSLDSIEFTVNPVDTPKDVVAHSSYLNGFLFQMSEGVTYNYSLNITYGNQILSYDGRIALAEDDGKYLVKMMDNYHTTSQANIAARGTGIETEPNDSYSTADSIDDGGSMYGNINSTDYADWYSVTFAKSGFANFFLGEIPTGCDYDLHVYDSSGTTILKASANVSNANE